MEKNNGYEENRQRKLEQQDGRQRNPLEQRQVEQWIVAQLLEPQQFGQEQLQPQQPPLSDN
jgi:hypothetical protein